MTVDAILKAVAILIAGFGGIYIAIHEVRRKERRTIRKEIDELNDEVAHLYNLLLEQRHYIYRVVMVMIDAGLDPPRPPDPSFDRDEYPDAQEPQ